MFIERTEPKACSITCISKLYHTTKWPVPGYDDFYLLHKTKEESSLFVKIIVVSNIPHSAYKELLKLNNHSRLVEALKKCE